MGQTVELPDPLDPSSSNSASAPGVDDLLSQLAGEEIDRLLAEAETEGKEQRKDTAAAREADVAGAGQTAKQVSDVEAARSGSPADTTEAVSSQFDELFAELKVERLSPRAPVATNSAGKSPEAASVEQATADVSAQLDALFTDLNEPKSATPAKVPTPVQQIAKPAASRPAAESASAAGPKSSMKAEDLDAALAQQAESIVKEAEAEARAEPAPPADVAGKPAAPAETMAPAKPPAVDEPATAATDPELLAATGEADSAPLATDRPVDVAQAEEEVDEPLPIVLRPLEWINAPLAHCPPVVREALGKVAILTLINAVAVLLYVVLFRR